MKHIALSAVLGMAVGSLTLLGQPYAIIFVSLVASGLFWAGLQ